MRKLLVLVLSVSLFSSCFCQSWSRLVKVEKYKGKTVNLLGQITNVKYNMSANNAETLRETTFVFGDPQAPSVIINLHNTERLELKYLKERGYLNRYVQVTGKVELINNKPQITIQKHNQIRILHEAYKNGLLVEPE